MHTMATVVMAIAARAAMISSPRGRRMVSVLELSRPLGSSIGVGDETRKSKGYYKTGRFVNS